MLAPKNSARLRRRLVRGLEERGLLVSDRVRAAFLAVPREIFLPEYAEREGVEAVYRDEAILTKFDARGFAISSSSQPAIMAEMLEQLALEPGMRVLEIGAGTGYNAALLAEIVGPDGAVTSIDIDAEVARGARAALRRSGHRVRVLVGDGREGFRDGAPYDRIIVTASAETVPRAWFDQVAEHGLLEVPLRLALGVQLIPTLRKVRTRLASVGVVCGGFMPLRGGEAEGAAAVPAQPPCLVARDETGEQPREPLRQISGAAVGTLSPRAKRRLLAVALADGRRRPLRIRAEVQPLLLYLTLALPAARAVTVLPGWGIGLISRDGTSLAYVHAAGGGDTHATRIRSVTAHGGSGAEEALVAAIAKWDRLGRPGPAHVRVTVDYARSDGRVRRSLRTPNRQSRELKAR